ncbi:hypothetical protein DEDE109153_17370 [Deinococcus deserti]
MEKCGLRATGVVEWRSSEDGLVERMHVVGLAARAIWVAVFFVFALS